MFTRQDKYIFSIVSLLIFHWSVSISYAETHISIIPDPVTVHAKQGFFELTSRTMILADQQTQSLGLQLSSMLAPATGFECAVKKQNKNASNTILLVLSPDLKDMGQEGYKINVNKEWIQIEAPEKAGIFYGMQTLMQLLPVQIFQSAVAEGVRWNIPCVDIEDEPRFQWRGMHLDVSRHFMPIEFVKKFIELMAFHKMNVFHWHLTDDQGWRIEIKKYPKLTGIGAWRKETVIGWNSAKYDGKPHGGFYTQDEIREIVEYAKQRHITVVPEIEMPGHSMAALAAYPELSCTGGPFEVRRTWGIEKEVYCAGNDQTFQFLQDVLDEVLQLFPSPYIHIGGDECPKVRWKECAKCQARIKSEDLKDEHELQSWFIKRMEKYLNSHGRRLIGWDEILEGGLAPNAAVMSWRGEKGGIAAAQAGHDVVMTPLRYTYLNLPPSDHEAEPWGHRNHGLGLLPLDEVYGYNPVPEILTMEQRHHILGVQAQLWTEYIPTPKSVEYLAFPRTCALAEVAWTPQEKRNWDDFSQRLARHYARLDLMGVYYRVPNPEGLDNDIFLDNVTVEITKPLESMKVYFTLDGTEPTPNAQLYTQPITISETTTIKVKGFLSSGRSSATCLGTYEKQSLREPVDVDETNTGIKCEYRIGNVRKVKMIDELELKKTTVETSIGIPSYATAPAYALTYTGFFQALVDGVYTFYTFSDDGSQLLIGEKVVVDNDESHSPQERSGQIALKAGIHPIKVLFFESGESEVLRVSFQAPNQNKKIISASQLFY